MKDYLFRIIFNITALGLIFLIGCAKIVTPTGGPKDEEHPLIVEVDPPYNTINFKSDKVNITFNEFIQLNDLNNSLVISPPIEETPDIKVKGKTLEIEFLEELKDSTTYNIYFGNSVQDFNEGNPIENFQYILSTGDYIDSLSITGKVINAFNLLPEEGVFVMLYEDFEDSVPIKQIPTYLSKTNAEGLFTINNISNNKFKLFCVRDFNKNYLFDLPNEDIAFIDSLVEFELITEVHIDTFYLPDSIYILNEQKIPETLEEREIDTIATHSHTYFPVHEYTFRLFAEYHEVQYLTNNTREKKQKVEVTFNKPIKDSILFSLADTIIENEWFKQEISRAEDSVIFWLTDSAIYNQERLQLVLGYQKEDSNLVYQWSSDTLNLRFVDEGAKRNEEPDTALKYELNIKERGTMDLNKNISFQFETPLASFDTSKINLIAVIDSVELPVIFDFVKDSIENRKYWMQVNWSEDTIYRLEAYPNAFTDIYQTVNDTNVVMFASQKRDYYGKILVDITGMDSIPEYQLVCQLVVPGKDKEVIHLEQVIQNNQLIEFDFLPPKEFMFKVILDRNFNGIWDTGEYLKHIQPEEVLYHEDKIKVRSNWDIEVNFDVNK